MTHSCCILFYYLYNLIIQEKLLGDKLKQKHGVGDFVLFFKKVSDIETEVPVGARGVVCDYREGDELPYYVTFNSISKADWFDEGELITVGTTNEN